MKFEIKNNNKNETNNDKIKTEIICFLSKIIIFFNLY